MSQFLDNQNVNKIDTLEKETESLELLVNELKNKIDYIDKIELPNIINI